MLGTCIRGLNPGLLLNRNANDVLVSIQESGTRGPDFAGREKWMEVVNTTLPSLPGAQ